MHFRKFEKFPFLHLPLCYSLLLCKWIGNYSFCFVFLKCFVQFELIIQDIWIKSWISWIYLIIYSNGGGRSGTFLALDANLELLKKTGKIDVYEYGKILINARPHLIDTVDQYQFIYDALAEVKLLCFLVRSI